MPNVNTSIKGKKILVYDYGLYTELAARLVRDGATVYYFTPWTDMFPKSSKQKIGVDFKGLKRVNKFWDYVDEVDAIVFFDTYCSDTVSFLRSKGYNVWGSGEAEAMETDRWKMRQTQQFLKMDTQTTLKLCSIEDVALYFKGIKQDVIDNFGSADPQIIKKQLKCICDKYNDFDETCFLAGDNKKLLIEWVNGAKDKYVKSNTRGDIETFLVPNYNDAVSKINHLVNELGHRNEGDGIEFTIEDRMEGIEPGWDGIQLNGEFYCPTMWGFERKSGGYIGRVCDYDSLPEPITRMNEQMSAVYKQLGPTVNFSSTEFILTKDKKNYLIDPTIRVPAPVGAAVWTELIENFGDMIYAGACGKLLDPIIKYKYAAGVCFNSDWAVDHELEVDVDKSIDQWVKFRAAYCRDGKYYVIPCLNHVVTVIALGNSIKEVTDLVEERAKLVKGYDLTKNTDGLKKILCDIEDARKQGLDF